MYSNKSHFLIILAFSIIFGTGHGIKRLSSMKSLKEMFKDLVPGIVPEIPRSASYIEVESDSEDGKLLLAREVDTREGQEARTWKYLWSVIDSMHDKLTYVHMFVDGQNETRLCEMVINIDKRGINHNGEYIVSDVSYYKSYPVYCKLFGNTTHSYDVFVMMRQSHALTREERKELLKYEHNRSEFSLKDLMEEYSLSTTYGETIKNNCDPSVRKKSFKYILYAIIFMASFGVLILGSSVFTMWMSRKKYINSTNI